jgi:metal-responsive CopG/Arc/MetJ family transcriptional regulator
MKKEFDVVGLSAPEGWWDEVSEQAKRLRMSRSEFVRFAVERLMQDREQIEEMEAVTNKHRQVFTPA